MHTSLGKVDYLFKVFRFKTVKYIALHKKKKNLKKIIYSKYKANQKIILQKKKNTSVKYLKNEKQLNTLLYSSVVYYTKKTENNKIN